MPETPNSFEEWWKNRWPDRADRDAYVVYGEVARIAWNAAIASLSPQAAAVPARQDAVPEPPLVEKDLRTEGEMAAHAGGAQTAVGEGELPRAIARMEEHRATNRGIILEYPSMAEVLDFISAARTQLREAIAQRDEARRGEALESDWLYLRYKESGMDGRLTFSGWINQRVTDCEAAEAKLVAATEFKPDEIRGLLRDVNELLGSTTPSGPRIDPEEWFDRRDSILSRLRSIPSEPAGKQGKAVEND